MENKTCSKPPARDVHLTHLLFAIKKNVALHRVNLFSPWDFGPVRGFSKPRPSQGHEWGTHPLSYWRPQSFLWKKKRFSHMLWNKNAVPMVFPRVSSIQNQVFFSRRPRCSPPRSFSAPPARPPWLRRPPPGCPRPEDATLRQRWTNRFYGYYYGIMVNNRYCDLWL